MVGLVAMVPMIIAPKGSITLVRARPHGRGSLEIGEVPNKGEEPVIGDVEISELGGGGGGGGAPCAFQIARQGASDPCFGCPFVRMSLWGPACHSGWLSLQFARLLECYLPVWRTYLPDDIILPWLRADLGIKTGRTRWLVQSFSGSFVGLHPYCIYQSSG